MEDKKKTTLKVEAQKQVQYTTEYRINKPSRLILTTDKDLYDKAIKSGGTSIVMVADIKESEKICLSRFGQPLYLIQIPLDE